MTFERWAALAGALLLIAALALTALTVGGPKLSAEAYMRYASETEAEEDDGMAELLMLLNGE